MSPLIICMIMLPLYQTAIKSTSYLLKVWNIRSMNMKIVSMGILTEEVEAKFIVGIGKMSHVFLDILTSIERDFAIISQSALSS